MGDVRLLPRAEQRREHLQRQLDALKTQRDRNVLGQFATPGPLATEVVKSARALLGTPSDKTAFMDPAFGTGAFYSALLEVFRADSLGTARGFEIDPHYGRPASSLWEGTRLRLDLCDFTSQRPADDDLVDLLICNPPYVRHHHIEHRMKRRLAGEVQRSLRIRVSGLAGLYVYFMLVGHRWLKPQALSVWLVPSEFMDVNYGSALKDYLLDRVDLIRIHRFDPAEVQFGDAMVSSAVVWFWNRRPAGDAPEFTFGGSIALPRVRRRIDRSVLRGDPKWTRHPGAADAGSVARASVSTAPNGAPKMRCGDGPSLADLFVVKRGLVTGANRFFVLTEAQARASRISSRFLRPVLPSPRHLQTDVVKADPDGVPDIGKRLFLFDCRVPQEELERTEPTTAAYVKQGEAAGADRGYLASRRDPWYAQEHREPAPFLSTYMGRSLEGRPPFRIILNQSKAVATNVYLMLYPKTPPLSKAIRFADGRELVWRALCRTMEAEWPRSGRVYGGGLHKVEPGELGRLPADRLIDVCPEAGRAAVRQPTLL